MQISQHKRLAPQCPTISMIFVIIMSLILSIWSRWTPQENACDSVNFFFISWRCVVGLLHWIFRTANPKVTKTVCGPPTNWSCCTGEASDHVTDLLAINDFKNSSMLLMNQLLMWEPMGYLEWEGKQMSFPFTCFSFHLFKIPFFAGKSSAFSWLLF